MFNLQGSEIIFILLLALVVLGPEKLPGAVKRAMQTYAELRKLGTGFQDEFKAAIDQPMREMRETADLIKDQVDPKKVAEDAERAAEAAAAADRADAELAAVGGASDARDQTTDAADPSMVDDAADPFDDPFDDPIDDLDVDAPSDETGRDQESGDENSGDENSGDEDSGDEDSGEGNQIAEDAREASVGRLAAVDAPDEPMEESA